MMDANNIGIFYSYISPYKQILLFSNGANGKNKKNNSPVKNNKPKTANTNKKSNSNANHFINREFIKIYDREIVLKQQRDKNRKINPNLYKNVSDALNSFRSGLNKYFADKTSIVSSNAYIKAWEMYNTFAFSWKETTQFNSFHFSELPGNFIISLNKYCELYGIKLNWMAESLSPSLGGFGNDYELLKKNPKRYDFGPKNTGDIMDGDNIIYYYYKNLKHKPIFITSDAGENAGVKSYEFLQKLDLAQTINIIGSIEKGGDILVKHFTPFIINNKETYSGFEFFIDLMYFYCVSFKMVYIYKPLSSNVSSGEFYVIGLCKNSKMTMPELAKWIDILKNFKLNQRLFDIKMENTFVNQIYTMLRNLNNDTINMLEQSNNLFSLLDCGKNRAQCAKTEKTLEEISKQNDVKYDTWMNEYWNDICG